MLIQILTYVHDKIQTGGMSESNWWVKVTFDWVLRKALFEEVTSELMHDWQEASHVEGHTKETAVMDSLMQKST